MNIWCFFADVCFGYTLSAGDYSAFPVHRICSADKVSSPNRTIWRWCSNPVRMRPWTFELNYLYIYIYQPQARVGFESWGWPSDPWLSTPTKRPANKQRNQNNENSRITSFSSCQCLQQSTLQINSSMCKPHHESRSFSQQNRGFFHGFHGFSTSFWFPGSFAQVFPTVHRYTPGDTGPNTVLFQLPGQLGILHLQALQHRLRCHGDVDIKSVGKMVT